MAHFCFCDCEGWDNDDHGFGCFGWCKIRNIPITSEEVYRTQCKEYKNTFKHNKERTNWAPLIGRWLAEHQRQTRLFKQNFRKGSIIEGIKHFFGKKKYDMICPSCYGRGSYGCIHVGCRCELCEGQGGYNVRN